MDIVQHNGSWGFWATSGSTSAGDPRTGSLPEVRINSTWVGIDGTLNNAAKIYLDSTSKAFFNRDGYAMGIKSSSDISYERFWDGVNNALLGAAAGEAIGSLALSKYLGPIAGGAVGTAIGEIVPSFSNSDNTNFSMARNDLIIKSLVDNGLASYSSNVGKGGTLKFNNSDVSGMGTTIDMHDLASAIRDNMYHQAYVDNQGNINADQAAAYGQYFKNLTDGSTSIGDLINRLGGTSSRSNYHLDTEAPEGSIENGGTGNPFPITNPANSGSFPAPELNPNIPGTVQPIHTPEFYFYYEAPKLADTGGPISSTPDVMNDYDGLGGHITDNILTMPDGTMYLLVYCDNMHDAKWTNGPLAESIRLKQKLKETAQPMP